MPTQFRPLPPEMERFSRDLLTRSGGGLYKEAFGRGAFQSLKNTAKSAPRAARTAKAIKPTPIYPTTGVGLARQHKAEGLKHRAGYLNRDTVAGRQAMADADAANAAIRAPKNPFRRASYEFRKRMPWNTYNVNKGGMKPAIARKALGAGALGTAYYGGARQGATKATAETMGAIAGLPAAALLPFAMPNIFGQREWMMDKYLAHKQDNQGVLEKLFGIVDYGNVRNHLDNQRQASNAKKMEMLNNAIFNAKNLFGGTFG